MTKFSYSVFKKVSWCMNKITLPCPDREGGVFMSNTVFNTKDKKQGQGIQIFYSEQVLFRYLAAVPNYDCLDIASVPKYTLLVKAFWKR